MFFKKVFILSSGYLVNTIIAGLFGIYVTRMLGPSDKGVLIIAMSSCDLMMMLFSFGIPYSAAYYVRSHPGSDSVVLSQANKTMILCGALSLMLVMLGKDMFSSLFIGGRPIDAAMTALLLLTIIVSSGNTIIGATLVAQGDSNGYVMGTNIGSLVNIGCTLSLITMFEQFKLHAVLFGNLAGILVAAVIMRKSIRVSDRTEHSSHQELTSLKLYTYGIQAQSGAIAALVFKRVDLYIIGHFLGTTAIGFYSVGLGLRDLAMAASRALAGLAAGDMADPGKQRDGTAQRILKKGVFFNVGTSLIAFLGAVVIFPYFIPLAYGESFSKSVTYSIIIMGSLLPFSIAFFVGKAIQSKGRPMLQSICNVIGAVVCSIVVWKFTEHYGLIGAAVATIVTSSILLVLSWIFLKLSGDWNSAAGVPAL